MPPSQNKSIPPLASTIFDWENLTSTPTAVGARRDFFDGQTNTLNNFECHATTLNPGKAPHPPHRHPDEELVILREGTLEVTVNGVARRMGPGSIAFFASNDEHGMFNIGDVPATYHVLRWISPSTPKA